MREEKDLRQKIFLKLEEGCRRRGLIKRVAGNKTYYETHDERVEAFIEKFAEEIFEDYQAELAGLRKPFFTGPKGLERAISIACNHRINTLIREIILQRILKSLSMDEYIFSLVWDQEDNDESAFFWDAARPDNMSSFPESPSGFNSNPADDFEEAWVRSVIEKEHLKLEGKGKDGPLLHKVIVFYLDGHAESLNKWEEISALSNFLQVDRKRARELKCRGLFLFFKGISKDLPVKEAWKSFWHRRKLAKRFARQSDRVLLSTYSREREKKDPIPVKSSIKDYSAAEIAELSAKYSGPNSISFTRPWFLVCIGRRCDSCRGSRCFQTTHDLEDAA
jgi:hypothetical protein